MYQALSVLSIILLVVLIYTYTYIFYYIYDNDTSEISYIFIILGMLFVGWSIIEYYDKFALVSIHLFALILFTGLFRIIGSNNLVKTILGHISISLLLFIFYYFILIVGGFAIDEEPWLYYIVGFFIWLISIIVAYAVGSFKPHGLLKLLNSFKSEKEYNVGKIIKFSTPLFILLIVVLVHFLTQD